LCDYRDTPENDCFPSWHFARSNHRWDFLEHHPRVDPLLRIIDDLTDLSRLCCIGNVIPLPVELEAGHTQSQISVHVLTWSGLAAKANGSRLVGSYRVSTSCHYTPAFHVRLDGSVKESVGRLTWLLLPVCWQTGKGQTAGVIPEDAWMLDLPHHNSGLRHFSGLILQPRPNGELVRVGLLYNDEQVSYANLAVLLEAVQKAKPRLLMIS
jgi:hypothetical protein